MSRVESAEAIDAQLTNLRSSISDLAHEIDLYKTKTGGALGVGVFMLLLAAGAGYDLLAGKAAAWSMVGLTHETLISIAMVLAAGAILLLAIGFRLSKRRDASLDIKLDQMEQEYAELLDLKNRSS
jgi:type IV secretory pathway VirB6-like protein